MQNQKLSFIFALSAVLLWSTVATAFKISLRILSPIELLLYSSLTSLVFLTAILIVKKKIKIAFIYLKENFILVLILGAINPFFYYLVLFKAYDLLPAQEAQSINYTWALTLSYLGVIFLKHKLSKYDILAGIIAYFGVLIIATKGDIFSLHFSNSYGVLLAFFSTILWSFYWIFNIKSKVDPVVGLFCNFLIGVIFILFYFILFYHFSLLSSKALLSSMYVGFFEMGITYILWLKALKHSENTGKIANLIFLSPFLSLVFIHFIAGERIEVSTIIALVFIFSGLMIQRIKVKK